MMASLTGRPLYFWGKTPEGCISWRICFLNRAKATCIRKILSPPAVEPEQAPSASKMMKMMLVSGPQVPKSPRP
ncbi:hypothetical protein D3C80_1558520 [compost metagenome]